MTTLVKYSNGLKMLNVALDEFQNEFGNNTELFKCLIKADDTWVYGYDVETKVHRPAEAF